jgi:SAM-dependent methyltransferase
MKELRWEAWSLLRQLLVDLKIIRISKSFFLFLTVIWAKSIMTWINLLKNRKKCDRRLEIGPGNNRLAGFETLDIAPKKNVDYVRDCAKRLPFKNYTFDIVYSSHVFEHIPWYQVEGVLREWVRILKPSGCMELWVPDAVKICKAFVDAEVESNNYIDRDGWYKFNPEKDPCVWASGRIYTYGDGNGNPKSPNWHKALFSFRYLKLLMSKVGLVEIKRLEHKDIRGDDHGWINLGIKGTKP